MPSRQGKLTSDVSASVLRFVIEYALRHDLTLGAAAGAILTEAITQERSKAAKLRLVKQRQRRRRASRKTSSQAAAQRVRRRA